MKHHDERRVFEFVAQALIPYLVEAFPDLQFDHIWFTYAPRRRGAVVKYGVDQSERIAKELARICGGTFVSLLRRRGGREQKKLTAAERKKNVAEIFSLKEEYRDAVVGKTIVLVDDLLTTGATLGLCSSILASAGAAEVVALTVATTPERDEKDRRQAGQKRVRRKKRR
jgi:ComF family protein